VVFSGDGKRLAAASGAERAILLWDPATGKLLRKLDASPNGVGNLAFSPDSRLLAAGGFSGEVRVWDVALGAEVAADPEAHRGPLEQVAFAAQGDVVATASDDGTVRLWDAATGRQRVKLTHGRWVRAVALSPDGKWLASSSLDDTVRLWEAATGREIYRLPGHGKLGGHRALAFLADSRRFASWGDDMDLRVWDVSTGKALAEHALRPSGVEVPEDPNEGNRRRLMFQRSLGPAAFAPNGRVLVLNVLRDFHIFDVASGKELRKIAGDGGDLIALAVSPDGKWLLASAWGKPVQTRLADGRINSSTEKNHTVRLWELATGKEVRTIVLPEGGAGPVAFSADGGSFAMGTWNPGGRIRLWEAATGQELPAIEGFRGRADSLAFSPDGTILVSGMNDSTALVWDWTRGGSKK
jgi:WD40 repeat protein